MACVVRDHTALRATHKYSENYSKYDAIYSTSKQLPGKMCLKTTARPKQATTTFKGILTTPAIKL